jgi:hypothetical protein
MRHSNVFNESTLKPQTREFYSRVLAALAHLQIPFLVGGACALGCYTGVVRDTKDLDIFCHPRDVANILKAFTLAGYKTELTDSVWLGKIFFKDNLVDLIFGLRNSTAQVDEEWFTYARDHRILDFEVKLIPPEEMLWSKAFIMTRDRFDGADICHIFLHHADSFDWPRLVRRFGPNWRLLYFFFILFGYVYPTQRHLIPRDLMQEFAGRLRDEVGRRPQTAEPICFGPNLSATDYEIDIKEWGFIAPGTAPAAVPPENPSI